MHIDQEMDELKELLQTENDDFNKIFQKFMSLMESPAFRNMGKRKKNNMLEPIIEKAANDVGMSNTRVATMSFIRKYGFYHGSFFAGMPGIIIYFTDIKMGLIVLPRNFQGDNSFFRFSGTEIHAGGYIAGKDLETTH
ncbi:MAG TPA: hypothetical protein VK186_24260 [Candidatus Deferrimicrobium sp.]|nr:hypothetical protein [Candidatus Kapabacteria bacterium]HLP61979.1 hypothetical protein [Candidatus Deferrimicrobium sp.]